MSRLAELLQALSAASVGVPDAEVEPELVLEAAEHMMELRRGAFDALRAELEGGAPIDEESRAVATQLQAVDRAWTARMEAAKGTLARRLEGARRLKASLHRSYVGGNAAIEV
jgi:hypothetical protein